MDFVFLDSVRYQGQALLVMSYDIACQYFINLWRRMKKYLESLRLSQPRESVKIRGDNCSLSNSMLLVPYQLPSSSRVFGEVHHYM